MDTSSLVKKIVNKRTRDYGYLIAFFFLFSFFVFFVIRPNVLSVFSANVKIDELTKIDRLYGDQIVKVIDLQTSFENHRNDFYLLSDAISQKPQVNKILSDINNLTDKDKVSIDQININDINLKDVKSSDKLKAVIISFETKGEFESVAAFIDDMAKQRRLKIIKMLTMTTDKTEASKSGLLKMKFDIEGYYL